MILVVVRKYWIQYETLHCMVRSWMLYGVPIFFIFIFVAFGSAFVFCSFDACVHASMYVLCMHICLGALWRRCGCIRNGELKKKGEKERERKRKWNTWCTHKKMLVTLKINTRVRHDYRLRHLLPLFPASFQLFKNTHPTDMGIAIAVLTHFFRKTSLTSRTSKTGRI